MEAAADGAPAREALRDIVPFHAAAPKLDDKVILLRRPLALLFRRGLRRVRRHAELPATDPGTGALSSEPVVARSQPLPRRSAPSLWMVCPPAIGRQPA